MSRQTDVIGGNSFINIHNINFKLSILLKNIYTLLRKKKLLQAERVKTVNYRNDFLMSAHYKSEFSSKLDVTSANVT